MGDAERLQKVMAQAGIASRRASEDLIRAGRVAVNGRVVTEMGVRVDPLHDDIRVDGRQIQPPSVHRYLVLHKPAGYVTTAHDPQGRPTVVGLVRSQGLAGDARVYPVGRLDIDTEGLLLLTDDGELTHALTHPRFHIGKRYWVEAAGRLMDEQLARLAAGMDLEDGATQPARVELLERNRHATRFTLEIFEGRKRQIRRMCEALRHPVRRLIRTGMGPLELGSLPVGHVRELHPRELDALRQALRNAQRSGQQAGPRRAAH